MKLNQSGLGNVDAKCAYLSVSLPMMNVLSFSELVGLIHPFPAPVPFNSAINREEMKQS